MMVAGSALKGAAAEVSEEPVNPSTMLLLLLLLVLPVMLARIDKLKELYHCGMSSSAILP